ncbi:hypothetical protein HOE04_00745 [archaeon]|jgi:hypothetical protein|nr:hypothetical protein [archaeon]
MNNTVEIIEKIFKIPERMNQDREILVIPPEQMDNVLTDRRRKILQLLIDQNPINKEKLDKLFHCNTQDDLNVLKYFKLINLQKINENEQHDVITLNKNIDIH